MPLSLELYSAVRFEQALTRGTNEIAIDKDFPEADRRGGVPALIAKVLSFFIISTLQLNL